MPVTASLIADLPVLKGLTTVDLEELASHMELSELPEKQLIIKEGDDPDHPIYLLLSGTVEIFMRGADGRDHVIATLAGPSIFGEIEVLARRDAIAAVVSTSPVRLGLLRRGVFDEICEADRPCALKLLKNLSRTLAYRLAATDARMASYFNATRHSSPAEFRGALWAWDGPLSL